MFKKKEKLYIKDLLPNPALEYPGYYILSAYLAKNELLQSTLIALHSFEFSNYKNPESYDEIFAMVKKGQFSIYKEKYAVGYFGGKLMYLEPYGWKAMPVTKDLFDLNNWLIC